MGDEPPQGLGEGPSLRASTAEEFPTPPGPAKSWWRRRWRLFLLVAVVIFGGRVVSALLLNKALPSQLIMADFRKGVEPFNPAADSFARYDSVEGTFVLTSEANRPIMSVGEFGRAADAVGIRAEFVEMAEPGTFVGVMCLSPAEGEGAFAGGRFLSGYGFLVEPGGHFILARQDPDGSLSSLQQGTDARIDKIQRVSVKCVREHGDVSLTGFANGLEVVMAAAPDRFGAYTHAGLIVVAQQAGSEVRFTRVLARVPDKEWMA
jgi:hypothetical protein